MAITVLDVRDIINRSVSVPTCAGVYAWYRRLDLNPSSRKNFLNSIEQIMTGNMWLPIEVPSKSGTIGPYRVRAVLSPPRRQLTGRKIPIAEALSATSASRAAMSRLAVDASALQSPLYIGRAVNLRTRIVQGHLQNRTDFSRWVTRFVSFSQLIVAFVEITSLPPNTCEILESLVGTAGFPSYARRIG